MIHVRIFFLTASLLFLFSFFQAEITAHATGSIKSNVIHDVHVHDKKAYFLISGLIKSDYKMIFYTVDNGHDILLEGKFSLNDQEKKKTPKHITGGWQPFQLVLYVPESLLPSNTSLNLVLAPSPEKFSDPQYYFHCILKKA